MVGDRNVKPKEKRKCVWMGSYQEFASDQGCLYLFMKIRHHNALMNHDVIIHIFILYTFFFVKFLFDKII